MSFHLLAILLFSNISFAKQTTEKDLSPQKPKFESQLKVRSQQKLMDDLDVITNAGWNEKDFEFTNAVLIRTPLRYARERITNFELYKQMSPAIHKFNYDSKTNLIEVEGEAGGLRLHSWVRPDLKFWDEIDYEFVAGDLKGFRIQAFLWEKNGQTITLAKGLLPSGKTRFPQLVGFAFPTVAEIVLSVATKNFRKFIEGDYNERKGHH